MNTVDILIDFCLTAVGKNE